jgi:hypothetical protein
MRRESFFGIFGAVQDHQQKWYAQLQNTLDFYAAQLP